MFKAIASRDLFVYNERPGRALNKKLFNTTDTFCNVLARYQDDTWNAFVELCKKEKMKLNILFDDKAINHYVSHRNDFEYNYDTKTYAKELTPRQRLIIYEFDSV